MVGPRSGGEYSTVVLTHPPTRRHAQRAPGTRLPQFQGREREKGGRGGGGGGGGGRGVRLVVEQERRLHVGQEPGQLPRGQADVERDEDGAEATERVGDEHEVGAVASQQGNAVAAANAMRRQATGGGANPLGQLREGPGDGTGDQRGLLRVGERPASEPVRQRGESTRVVAHGTLLSGPVA